MTESTNMAVAMGAVYVYRRTGNLWVQESILEADNQNSNDFFGASVSIHGDTLVVGAPNESSSQTVITAVGDMDNQNHAVRRYGAAYVYKRTNGTWALEAYLKAPNASAGDEFGNNVAIHGDTVVVGARYETSDETTITNGSGASTNAHGTLAQAGAAYVFKRIGNSWAQEAYLKPPNTTYGETFGWSVAIHADTVVVGAFNEMNDHTTITNSNDNFGTAGAAYVFKRTGNSWAYEAYLKAPNLVDDQAMFGYAVAISDNTTVVSALLETNSKTGITNGATPINDTAAQAAGAAFVFKRTGTDWAQEAYLKAPNHQGEQFGSAVAIDGNTIVVGAKKDANEQRTVTNGNTVTTNANLPSSGAAYVFKRTGHNWAQQAYLKAANANTNDEFGISVGVSANTVVVGAWAEGSDQNTITNGTTANANNSAQPIPFSGAAYVYIRQ